MFDSRSAYYSKNVHDGVNLQNGAAYLHRPDGKEPGVAILAGNMPRFVLREDHTIASRIPGA